jgi:BpuSI N-terminal domain/N-6 DNA Methylase
MPWLRYSDDEVSRFHAEFESAARVALDDLRLPERYVWTHHVRVQGETLIPDFVLMERTSGRWIVAFELKRTRESVYSTRFQIQAKGYADLNQDKFPLQRPKFFAISNLEVTQVFALHGGRPPRECRIEGGFFDSGRFLPGTAAAHRRKFIDDLKSMTQRWLSAVPVSYESVWPAILLDFINRSAAIIPTAQLLLIEPTTPNWSLVRDYFGSDLPIDSARIFLLRCLMAEYLRGLLIRYEHPLAAALTPVRETGESLARTIAGLRAIDFSVVFEAEAPDLYRTLADPAMRDHLRDYLQAITAPGARIVDLALGRVDYPELIDDLISVLVPVEIQDESGRIQTDPELAQLLATLVVDRPGQIIDPCCGDGALLSAGYDQLQRLGCSNEQALGLIVGIEADTIASRLAAVRLALKEPSTLRPDMSINIVRGDMFAATRLLSGASFVLMNPPFKRYEAQDARPVPPALRAYYKAQIEGIDGTAATLRRQPNLFAYYAEMVGRTIQIGATVGFILDNRWYHNAYGTALRRFLLDKFEILGIVEYPHDSFFETWSIATSLLIARRTDAPGRDHPVQFIRSKVDPRSADLSQITRAFHMQAAWPADWTCQIKPQSELTDSVGWRSYFSVQTAEDYLTGWPTLPELFATARRGSLEKEGSIGVLEFPFGRPQYGPRREALAGGGFKTTRGRALTVAENTNIRRAADRIPNEFRGWALRNSDDTTGFELTEADVQRQQTIEPPRLRQMPRLFFNNRSAWTEAHEAAVEDMMNDPRVRPYIESIEGTVNLNDTVLEKEKRWLALREPYAGELILPRKTRTGHRVYVNPFSLIEGGRQVRISSNFLTYGNVLAIDEGANLDRGVSVRLIAAFLVSSFGQVQFEAEGVNREGCLSVEQEQISRIRVFDPRWIAPGSREPILEAFRLLPYPVATDRLSSEQPLRNELDRLFSVEIARRMGREDSVSLLNAVHSALDEWIEARRP